MVAITSKNANAPKHVTFIDAGLKGDDTFAVSNALYMIDYLSKNPNYVKIMDYLIVPCGNPDAYDSFIKSKVKGENTSEVNKRASNCNIPAKKPCIQSLKNRNKELSSSGSSSSEDLPFIYVNANKNGKNIDPCHSSSENPRKNVPKETRKSKSMNNTCHSMSENKKDSNFRMDLTLNFPVVLGLNDMRNLPTDTFLGKENLFY